MLPVDTAFEELRPDLGRLAYRMLGSLADADDVLQDAYLRWSRDNRDAVDSPRAYLSSIVTRLCIDRRRADAVKRETYVGPWLPEPIVESENADGESPVEAAESVSMAFLIVLESLTPVERGAYLLRRIFDYDYSVIAGVLGESEANCRQLVSRAEKRIADARPRFEASRDEAERLSGAFLQACATGDLDGLLKLLADDVVMYSDGGGKAAAALAPVRSADHVARFFLGITKKFPGYFDLVPMRVNGRPGFVAREAGGIHSVLTFEIADGRITHCFIVRNPDKLARVRLG